MKYVYPAQLIRPDGRPEAYDIPKGAKHYCQMCILDGHTALHDSGKIVIMPGHNFDDGESRVVCIEKHCPDNVVIYNPATGLCRDKKGENVWREGGSNVVSLPIRK